MQIIRWVLDHALFIGLAGLFIGQILRRIARIIERARPPMTFQQIGPFDRISLHCTSLKEYKAEQDEERVFEATFVEDHGDREIHYMRNGLDYTNAKEFVAIHRRRCAGHVGYAFERGQLIEVYEHTESTRKTYTVLEGWWAGQLLDLARNTYDFFRAQGEEIISTSAPDA